MTATTLPVPVERQVRLHTLSPDPSGDRGGEVTLYTASAMAQARHSYRVLRQSGLIAPLARSIVVGLILSTVMSGGEYTGRSYDFTAVATLVIK